MSLPWDDPGHDVLADLREAHQKGKGPMPVYTDTPSQSYAGKQPAEVEEGKKAIAIFSGGLDSTALVFHLLNQKYDLHLLSFDYGQRHKKELEFAATTAKHLELRHDIVDLTGITHLISNSALTSIQFDTVGNEIEVPEGHYAEDNMKLTVVPNRNMIMASIAAGVAVNEGAQFIATAVHAGDHFVYPDCRPVFWHALARAIDSGNDGFSKFRPDRTGSFDEPVETPFLYWSKADIAYRALELGVPLHMTWSCYKGGEKHCGRCGTCVERLEAIAEAIERINRLPLEQYTALSVAEGRGRAGEHWDRTEYEDVEFWKARVSNA